MANVMRMSPSLPWDRDPDVERRFHRLLAFFLGLILVVGFLVAVIKLPEPPRVLKSEISERLVQLVQERKEVPPPPPVEQPKVEEEKKPEVAEEKPIEKPKPQETKPVETPKPIDAPPVDVVRKEKAKAEARKQIAAAGFDALADLRAQTAPAAKPASGQQLLTNVAPTGYGDAPSSQRALIADRAKAGSGGVVTARASVDQGNGSGIAGSGTSRVVSGIGGIQTDDVSARPASTSADKPNADKAGKGRRPDENIQLAFDTAKGGLTSLYHRALRNNPDMKGRVVFRLEIQADGHVSACEIATSELNDSELERKLLAKVKQIDFGAMNVDVWKDVFRMDFFP